MLATSRCEMFSLRRAQPVDVHLQRRVVQHLHQVRVGDARDLGACARSNCRPRPVARSKFDVLDLHVDRRRQAEIQHLADDVGGLEIEDAAGELVRAAGADGADVVDRRVVVGLQRDQDLRVHRADIVARHEGQVERGRHADRVVDGVHLVGRNDLADAVLDLQHEFLGPLEPRAGRRAVVQLDQADIGGREEVQADDRGEAAGDHQQQAGARQHERAAVQRAFQQPAVGVPEPAEARDRMRRRSRAAARDAAPRMQAAGGQSSAPR